LCIYQISKTYIHEDALIPHGIWDTDGFGDDFQWLEILSYELFWLGNSIEIKESG